MKLRIAGISYNSVVDGNGLRTTIFFQGCKHACEGCHNSPSWDFDGGYEVTVEELIEMCEVSQNKRVTLSGGDPLFQLEGVAKLVEELKFLDYEVWVYTGFTYNRLLIWGEYEPSVWRLLCATDVLVDGKFEIDKRDLTLPFRGSSNQRVLKLDEAGVIVGELFKV